MNFWEALTLGAIQGLTEFLPISSSGHLVILQRLLKLKSDDLLLEVIVHCATLVCILVVFWKDVWRIVESVFKVFNKPSEVLKDEDFRMLWYLVIGTIPAGIVGILWKDTIEEIFHSTRLVGMNLIITSCILGLTDFFSQVKGNIRWWQALIIGFAQAVAILPGISRSGITIATGLYLGIRREESARFSFLLSIPAILGALILSVKDVLEAGIGVIPYQSIIVSFLSALVFGYIALKFLLRVVQRGKLSYFAPYCLILGVLTILFLA